MEKKDCFACYETSNGILDCSALDIMNCEKCKFYRNDLNRKDIEKDIKKYSSFRSVNKNEY